MVAIARLDGRRLHLLILDLPMRLLLLLLIISIFVVAESYAGESVFSPHHKFRCDFVLQKTPGMTIKLIDCATGKVIRVAASNRWAEINWSPVDREFALVDHWDGQASSLRIFRIDTDANNLNLMEQYHSPGLQTLGVEWEMKTWSLKDGKAWIRRKQVLKPLDLEIKHLEQEAFCIPID